MTDPHVGRLAFFRVYSGSLEKGSQILNPRTGNKERMGRILEMHANDREDVDAVYTGDIMAAIGIKDVRTGDSLVAIDKPLILEEMTFPDPVIDVAVEPKSKADQEKLSKALMALSQEDPTFRVHTDQETAQTILSGMGELHLEVLVDRMLREFNVDASVGKPQVAYRETITKEVTTTYTHKNKPGDLDNLRRLKLMFDQRSLVKAIPSMTIFLAGESLKNTFQLLTLESKRQ